MNNKMAAAVPEAATQEYSTHGRRTGWRNVQDPAHGTSTHMVLAPCSCQLVSIRALEVYDQGRELQTGQ